MDEHLVSISVAARKAVIPEMRSTPKLPQTLDDGGLVSRPVGSRGDPGLCRPLPSPADWAKESRAFGPR